ncbi:MAG: polyprenyl synthetase family protein [Clostridia bacterium]|nr:polyprenyl synthetase family protein [Clostridia bacterium]
MIVKSKEEIEKINKYIDTLIADEEYIYESTSKTVSSLIKTFKDANDGGKRVRALNVLLGYKLAGNKEIPNDIYKAAASYEIFQTGILIHDDIIDESELRRGKPTVHKALGGDQIAVSNAICLGDFGIFLSQKILSKLDINPDRIVKALRIYNKTLMNTIIGELLDVNSPYSKHVSEERVIMIAYYKTAWYTIIGPMLLGAILGGANDKLIENIEKFGEHLGVAFQMKDDILGIFGTEDKVGKSVTSDIAEKKLTLLYLYVLEEGSLEQLEIFNAYYGKKDVTEKECEIIKGIMEDLKVRDRVEKIIKDESHDADMLIDKITDDEENREELKTLVDYLLNRDK